MTRRALPRFDLLFRLHNDSRSKKHLYNILCKRHREGSCHREESKHNALGQGYRYEYTRLSPLCDAMQMVGVSSPRCSSVSSKIRSENQAKLSATALTSTNHEVSKYLHTDINGLVVIIRWTIQNSYTANHDDYGEGATPKDFMSLETVRAFLQEM